MSLLLFDIDGTLLHTRGAGQRAMTNAGVQLFGERFTLEGYDTSGMLDPVIYAELAERCRIDNHEAHHDAFRDCYLVELARELAAGNGEVQAMPGMIEAVNALRRRDDVMLGLLTGNYTAAVPIKLKAVGIDPAWFPLTALGDEAPTRPDLVALAMRKYHERTGRAVEPQRVIVIGDTPRDIHCAHAHGCTAFAVATGRYSLADLQRHNPRVAVENLADPTPLFELL